MKLRLSAGPSLRVLLVLGTAVLLAHGILLLGTASTLTLRLPAANPAPVHVRMVSPVPAMVRAAPVLARPSRPVVQSTLPSVSPAAADAAAEAPQAAASEASEPQPVQPVEQTSSMASPVDVAVQAPDTAPAASQEAVRPALTTLPLISLGALPSSRLLSYQLNGMDKGLTYHANGELRWQHNDTAYELTLSVKAFLIGSRSWRSVGRIDATGLAPSRFSDSWRQERAAHFDREQQRIVFSSNRTPVAWQPGAQDQISLYVQLAAAMAGEPERFVPGARLQVQTATVRDALPWALLLETAEPQTVDGQIVPALKWVAQPRHQFDARVEFWVTQQHSWMPVRIRITQVSGSYIDLALRAAEPLPPLPVAEGMTPGAKGS